MLMAAKGGSDAAGRGGSLWVGVDKGNGDIIVGCLNSSVE